MKTKPIFFPFTFVPDYTAESFKGFFSGIKVYSPSNLFLQKDDFIETSAPICGDEEKIFSSLKQSKVWADIHQGTDISFFKTKSNKIPFFNEDSIAAIRSDIKGKKPQSDKNSELFFKQRMFLHFACQLDALESEIQHDFSVVNNMEKDMLKAVSEPDEKTIKADNSALIQRYYSKIKMIDTRLSTWAAVMCEDNAPGAFYITVLQDVLDYMTEKYSDIVKFDCITAGSKTKAELADYIKKTADDSWTGKKSEHTAEDSGSLSLYIVPNTKPKEFFGRFVKNANKADDCKVKNTILGVLKG